MDSRPLEYFLRVAELGSINKAAAALNLSQPALSRHIAALEHEVRVSLFNRTRGGVNLTEAGALLATSARPILRQLTILKEQLGERAAGRLSFGIPPSWHYIFTSQFVPQVTTECQGVKLRVYEGASNSLRDYMLAGLLDLAIVLFNPDRADGYSQTPLVREPAVLVGTKGANLDPTRAVGIEALDGLKLVLPGRPNLLRTQIENAMARKQLSFTLAAEVDTVMLCLTMAQKGVAYTVVPGCSLFGASSRQGVSWAPIRGMFLTWVLYENEARSHSQAVREGRRLAMNLIDFRLASGSWPRAERPKAITSS